MCVESATAVARLLRIYEKHYTFRRMNNQVVAIIFSAALMLLFVTVSSSPLMPAKPGETNQSHPRNSEMVAYLNLCFRALDELGQSFENAKRTRDYLVTLQRRWQAHMRRSGPGAKRQISSANSPSLSSQQSTSRGNIQSSNIDASRKKTRLDQSDRQSQSRHSYPSMGPTTTANVSVDPSQQFLSHNAQHPYQEHSFATSSTQPSDLDWVPESGLNLVSDSHGLGDTNVMGGLTTPQFPDLGDLEGWWSPPGGHSG